jgi:hypothetical protein
MFLYQLHQQKETDMNCRRNNFTDTAITYDKIPNYLHTNLFALEAVNNNDRAGNVGARPERRS